MAMDMRIEDFEKLLNAQPEGTAWISTNEVIVKSPDGIWVKSDSDREVIHVANIAIVCYAQQDSQRIHWSLS